MGERRRSRLFPRPAPGGKAPSHKEVSKESGPVAILEGPETGNWGRNREENS
jgi:hypothetical protein